MAHNDDRSGNDDLLQVRCDGSFKRKLRVEAAKAGQQMSEYVRSTLRASWSGTTDPNKDPDMSTCTPEPSGDSEGTENSQYSGKSPSNQGGSSTDSDRDSGENYQTE